jgi:alpha-tubulin suppressor-like RCC1 family protein
VNSGTGNIFISQAASGNYTSGNIYSNFIVDPISVANNGINFPVKGYLSGWGQNNGYLGMNNNINNNITSSINNSIHGSLTNRQVAMVAFNGFSIALDVSGHVHTWGANDQYQLGNGTTNASYVPIDITGYGSFVNLFSNSGYIRQITAGFKCAFALDSNGSIHAWGYNINGQLGNGGTSNNITPTKINSSIVFTSVNCGYATVGAIDTSGYLYTWGYNNYGQIGNGTNTSPKYSPTIINSSTNPIANSSLTGKKVIQYASYTTTSIALDSSGNIHTWGQNTNALGISGKSITNNYVPLNISQSTSNFYTLNFNGATGKFISCGGNGSNGNDFCVICDSNGYIWSWGYNGNGQLGLSNTSSTSTPIKIMLSTFINYVAAGLNGTNILDSNGNLYTAGSNSNNQIGNPNTSTSTNITSFMNISNYGNLANRGTICSFTSAFNTTQLIIQTAGTAVNPFITFNININNMINNRYTIIQPTISKGFVSYTIDNSAVAIINNNIISILQIGSFNITASIPASFSAYGNYTSGSISTTVTVNKLSIGFLNAWGYNNGNIGNGTALSNYYTVPINMNNYGSLVGKQVTSVFSSYYNYSIVLDAMGQVHTWGTNNTYGQLGTGGTTVSYIPVNISVISNNSIYGKIIKQISIGYYCCFALDTSGNIHVWGYNNNGQLGNGTITNSSYAINISSYGDLNGKTIAYINTCRTTIGAIDIYGNLYTWGNNSNGQLGNNSTSGQLTGNITSNYSTIPLLCNNGSINGKPIQQYASGFNVSIALDIYGQVHTWGNNSNGGLGNNNTGSSYNPINISSSYIGNKVISISCGGDTNTSNDFCIISDNANYIWSWGSNKYGQLGLGNTNSPYNYPIQTGFSNIIQSVYAGTNGSTIVDYYGNIYTCGYNDKNQLGNPNISINTSYSSFQQINSFGILNNTGLIAYSASPYNTTQYMITVAGTAANPFTSFYVPIHNMINQKYTIIRPTLSRGNISYSIDNISIATINGSVITVLQVGTFNITATIGASYTQYGNFTSGSITTAVTVQKIITSGYVSAWGANSGRIGNGSNSTTSILVPTSISNYGSLAGKLIAMIETSDSPGNTIALDTSGQVHTWGISNNTGQLGYGNTNVSYLPINISSNGSLNGKFITMVSISTDTCFAIDSSGQLHSWGGGNYGKLGNGSLSAVYTPQNISNFGDLPGKNIIYISRVTTGNEALGAIDSYGNLYTWGYNTNGALGNGTISGVTSTTGLTNSYGSLPLLCNMGSLTNIPLQQYACNNASAMALDVFGNVHIWGNNSTGQLGNGSITTTVTYYPINISNQGSLNGQIITKISSASSNSGHFCVVCDITGNAHSWGFNNQYNRLLLYNNSSNPILYPTCINSNIGLSAFIISVNAGSGSGGGGTNMIDTNGILYNGGYNPYGQIGNNTIITPISINIVNNYGNLINTGIVAGYVTAYFSTQFLITNPGTPINAISSFGMTNKYLIFPSITIQPPVNNGTSPITYTSLNTNIATIESSTGVLNTIALGSCTIQVSVQASYSSSGNYSSQTILSTFQVLKDPTPIKTPGYLQAWGNDFSPIYQPFTYNIGSLVGKRFVQVSNAEGGARIVLDASGHVHTWIDSGHPNQSGQLGNGTSNTSSNLSDNIPQDISSFGSLASVFQSNGYVVYIASAGYNSYAIDSFGQLHAWGADYWGSLGSNNTSSNYIVPVNTSSYGALNGKILVSLATMYWNDPNNPNPVGVIDINGNVYTWGYGTNGSGLRGNFQDSNGNFWQTIPLAISQSGSLVNNPIVKMSISNISMALDVFGHLHVWGTSWSGSFPSNVSTPVDMCVSPIIQNTSFQTLFQNGGYITDIAAGMYANIVCDSNGEIHTWGANNSGELGIDYDPNNFVSVTYPVNISRSIGFSSFIVKVYQGYQGCKLIDTCGNLYCFGNNQNGQIGNNTIDTTGNSPVTYPTLINNYGSLYNSGIVVAETCVLIGTEYVITIASTPVAPTLANFIIPNQYITYDPYNIVNPVLTTNSNGPITYSITSGSSNAIVAYTNNIWQITPIAIGTVTIIATQAAYYDPCGNFTSGTISTSFHILPAYTFPIPKPGYLYAFGEYKSVYGDPYTIPMDSRINFPSQNGPFYTVTPTIIKKLKEVKGIFPSKGVNSPSQFIIDTYNNVWIFGIQYNGSDGTKNNSLTNYSSPVQVSGLSNMVMISTPMNDMNSIKNATIGLDLSGNVWVWGSNQFGALPILGKITTVDSGIGIFGNNGSGGIFLPTKVNGLSNVRYVETDGYIYLACDNSGNIYYWGSNAYGGFGDGGFQNGQNTQLSIFPITKLQGVQYIIQMSCFGNVLALDIIGRVWFWGNNQFGTNGSGISNGSFLTPAIIQGLSNIISIQNGGSNPNTALDANGNIWLWGQNAMNAVGYSSISTTDVPFRLINVSSIISISPFSFYGMGLSSNGYIYSWGNLSRGGDGTAGTGPTISSGQIVNNISNVLSIGMTQATNGTGYAIVNQTPILVSGSFATYNPILTSNPIVNISYTIIDPSSNPPGTYTYLITSTNGSQYASISNNIITITSNIGGPVTITATETYFPNIKDSITFNVVTAQTGTKYSLITSLNNYLTYNTSSSLLTGLTSFTIEGWVYLTALPTTSNSGYIIGDMLALDLTNYWSLGCNSNGTIFFNLFTTTGRVTLTSNTTISTNTWNHIAVVGNGTRTYLYINGTQNTFITYSTPNGTINKITIGQYYNASYFNGYSNNLRISNIARYTASFTPSTSPFTSDSNTKFLMQFNGTSFVDKSQNNLFLTVYGSPSVNSIYKPFS